MRTRVFGQLQRPLGCLERVEPSTYREHQVAAGQVLLGSALCSARRILGRGDDRPVSLPCRPRLLQPAPAGIQPDLTSSGDASFAITPPPAQMIGFRASRTACAAASRHSLSGVGAATFAGGRIDRSSLE